MDRLLNTGLDKTARLVHVEKNIGAAIKIILSVKEAVDSALQAVPIAAVAWAGVCVALQVSPPHIRLLALNTLGLSNSGQRDDGESGRNYASHPDHEMVLESFEALSWGDI
jgi:hypothetical protein